MSENIRTYADIENAIKSSIAYYDDRISLWKAVKYPAKKDGTPFKVLSKNFDGARIGAYYPVEDAFHPYLTVSGRDSRGQWISDHLEIYMSRYNERLPQHNEKREIRHSYCDIEVLTLEEIKSEIQTRIETYTRLKEDNEKQLAELPEVFAEIQPKIDAINKVLKPYSNINRSNSLYYAFRDYVEHKVR